jgi:DnaK suppressor protein
MIDKEVIAEIREILLDRRGELINLRRSLNESWQILQEPEKELEETASKGTISLEMQRRGDNVQSEIRNIDAALVKMDEGEYGRCEACRRPIKLQRLQALPWARHCVDCAGIREKLSGGGIDSPAVTTDETELTDEEMLETIQDDLRSDGRVDTEELVIACEDGVVYLEGVLSSETEHQILLEIVNDVLDFNEVVDDIRVDRQPWERRERQPGTRVRRHRAEELVGEEDKVGVGPHTSLETGEPMTPTDTMIPEEPN